ncbi:MAG: ribonuclease R [Lachnospiraceae bacterium]|nr:ribonuclease R [Lachnospiraceae bacterium]
MNREENEQFKHSQQVERRKNLICELIEDEMYTPMKEKELAAFMQVSREEREAFREVLQALLSEGKIQVTRQGKYVKPDANQPVGTFISNAKGFGFVEIDGRQEDLYIPEDKTGGAFHLDKVQVALMPGQRGKRQEAAVIKILERGTKQIVGTYDNAGNFGFVVPDNGKIGTDIFVPKERSKGAVTGHKVVVELTSYGDERHRPEGIVTEILGHVNDPGVDIMSIVRGYGLPMEFGEKVMNQAGRVPEEVLESDKVGRMDLRDLQMVTIDGEDAKDLDDAVSLYRDEAGLYHLGVHIADVTNYVQENSALDWEALERGTSVYLVDRVIPMLPHKLSNGICSLNEGVERLALSCLMTINGKGEVTDYQIAETVICVDRRMSYTAVKKILEDRDETTIQEYESLVPMFEMMGELAAILRKRRHKRGSIDFDFPESKIVLNEDGHPIDIKPYERNVATKIIEDFMLIANETVAQHFFWLELPFVYRTHEKPDPDKIMKLAAFIRNFGYHIKLTGEEVHPKELQKLLDGIADTEEETLISRLTLRSMKQAKYTVDCTGHFGLACQYYCHFTSPIRRYPDLQIHRIIKEQLRGKLKENRIEHYEQKLPDVASRSSKMERRAEEAERETNKLKKVQYMEDHIGELYEGVISGITQWGIYVELPNTVEGLIHVSDLQGDYFYYDESAYEMVGKDSGLTYKLGQRLTIQVKDVDRFMRTINFVIADDDTEGLE